MMTMMMMMMMMMILKTRRCGLTHAITVATDGVCVQEKLEGLKHELQQQRRRRMYEAYLWENRPYSWDEHDSSLTHRQLLREVSTILYTIVAVNIVAIMNLFRDLVLPLYLYHCFWSRITSYSHNNP